MWTDSLESTVYSTSITGIFQTLKKSQHPHDQEIQMLAGRVIKGTGEKWIVVFQNALCGDMAACEYCSGSCVFMLFLIGLVCIGSTSQGPCPAVGVRIL